MFQKKKIQLFIIGFLSFGLAVQPCQVATGSFCHLSPKTKLRPKHHKRPVIPGKKTIKRGLRFDLLTINKEYPRLIPDVVDAAATLYQKQLQFGKRMPNEPAIVSEQVSLAYAKAIVSKTKLKPTAIKFIAVRPYLDTDLIEILVDIMGIKTVILAGSSQKAIEAIKQNIIPRAEARGRFESHSNGNGEFFAYPRSKFKLLLGTSIFINSGKTRFGVTGLEQLKKRPGIQIQNSLFNEETLPKVIEFVSEPDPLLPGEKGIDLFIVDRLSESIFRIIESISTDPEYRWERYWKKVQNTPTGRIKRQQSGSFPIYGSGDFKKVPLIVKLSRGDFLSPFSAKETELRLPDFLFVAKSKKFTEKDLKIGRDFFARYRARVMARSVLYPKPSLADESQTELVLQTLILLDWLDDFFGLPGGNQITILKLLEEILPSKQKPLLQIMGELQIAGSSNLDENAIDNLIRFIEEHVLHFESAAPQKSPFFKRKIEHPVHSVVMKMWRARNLINSDLRYVFRGVDPNLSPIKKLQELTLAVSENEIRRPLQSFLSLIKILDEEDVEASEKEALNILFDRTHNPERLTILEAADRLLDQVLQNTSISRENFRDLRKLVYLSLHDLVLSKYSDMDKYPIHFFYQKLIVIELQKKERNPDERLISRHLFELWVHFVDKRERMLVQMLMDAETEPERQSLLKKLVQFRYGIEKEFREFSRSPFTHFHFSIHEKMEELDSRIQKADEHSQVQIRAKQERVEKLKVPLAQFLSQLEKSATAKREREAIAREALSMPDKFNFALLYRVLLNRITNKHLGSVPLYMGYLNGNSELAKRLIAHFAALLNQYEIALQQVWEILYFQKNKDAVEEIDKLFSGSKVGIDKTTFYQLVVFFEEYYRGGEKPVINNEQLFKMVKQLRKQKMSLSEELGKTKTLIESTVSNGELTFFKEEANGQSFFKTGVKETIEKDFRDKAAELLTKAVLNKNFRAEEFYNLLRVVQNAYGDSFVDTLLYRYLQMSIAGKTKLDSASEAATTGKVIGSYAQVPVYPEFAKAFSKFKARPTQVPLEEKENLEIIENEKSLSRLFDLYVNMLLFEQNTQLDPYHLKQKVGGILLAKLEEKEKGRFMSWISGKSWASGVPVEIKEGYKEGVRHSVNRNFPQAVRFMQDTVKRIVDHFDKEHTKFRKSSIEGKNLREADIYELENGFYKRDDIADMREMFTSAISMLRYILIENQTGNAFIRIHENDNWIVNEPLNTEALRNLSFFLERKQYKNFLKRQLPRIAEMKIKGKNQTVRVYEFLGMGEGGKEGQYQYLQYAMFGTALYDYLGYSIVEIPITNKYGEFPSRYVAKIAQTDHVTKLYTDLLGPYFADFQQDSERFERNHLTEDLVNRFAEAFKRFLMRKAEQNPELKDYVDLLEVPDLLYTDDISGNQNPLQAIRLLLIGFVPNLSETDAPKTQYSTYEVNNLLIENSTVAQRVKWFLRVIKRKMEQDFKKRSGFKTSEIKAEKLFNKLKALSVVLNTALRNVDYGPFVAGYRLAMLDMEATFPHAKSSRFDPDLKEGDYILRSGGMIKEIVSAEDLQAMARSKRRKFKKFDPDEAVSDKFTWRLNNIFAFEGDDYGKVYKELVELMVEFLTLSEEFRFRVDNYLSSMEMQKEEVEAIRNGFKGNKSNGLRGIAETLPQDVQTLVKSRGVAYLNLRGEVLQAPLPQTGQVVVDLGSKSDEDETAELHKSLKKFTATMVIGQQQASEELTDSKKAKTVTIDPSKNDDSKYDLDLDMFDQWDDRTGQFKAVKDSKGDRSMEMTALDLIEDPEEYKKKTAKLMIEFDDSLRDIINDHVTEHVTKKKTATFLLMGRRRGPDVFVVTHVIRDIGNYQKTKAELTRREKLKEVYLGKWVIRSEVVGRALKESDFDVRKEELSKQFLNTKTSRRERLVIAVTVPQRIQQGKKVVKRFETKIWRIPSEGSALNEKMGKEALLMRGLQPKDSRRLRFVSKRHKRPSARAGRLVGASI